MTEAQALPTNHISRQVGPLLLSGVRATTLESLLGVLGELGDAPVFADLSMGAWRSNQVASEFLGQLCHGIEPSTGSFRSAQTSHSPADTSTSQADSAGGWIDTEAGGDSVTIRALDFATRVAAAATETPARVLVIVAPRFGMPWEEENVRFLRFLAEGVRGSGARLLLADTGTTPAVLPEDWNVEWSSGPPNASTTLASSEEALWELVPGLVEPEVLRALGKTGDPQGLFLANGSMLVPPECRKPPTKVSRTTYDRLAYVVRSPRYLQAYAQFYGSDAMAEPQLLCEEAQEQAAAGGFGGALRLIERAASCSSTPVQRALCRLQAQGTYIRLARFEGAARMPDPSPELPQATRGLVYQNKGWGMTMLGETAGAEACLREARSLLKPYGHTREYLYLLNISALNWVKSGEIEKALALERAIEAIRSKQAGQDWHLEYINSINLARLYSRRGNLRESERYYRRAFGTTLGARSESDLIYTNICLAKLFERQGDADQSFASWLRAGLHWVASRSPEALAPRAAASILGGRVAPGSYELVEQVSAALDDRLRASADSVFGSGDLDARVLDQEGLQPPVFVKPDDIPEEHLPQSGLLGVGDHGWGVLVSRRPVRPQFVGPSHLRLRRSLYGLLSSLQPCDDLEHAQTVVVDDRLGNEIPQGSRELLESCLRLRARGLVFADGRESYDPEERAKLEAGLRVRFGYAVDRIRFTPEGASVAFKRYLAPKGLDPEMSQILALMEDQPSLTELAERLDLSHRFDLMLFRLRALERERVVALYLPHLRAQPKERAHAARDRVPNPPPSARRSGP